jgi:DNA polymerase I-like protein with 3'-5' exonuclease and polymerase domains
MYPNIAQRARLPLTYDVRKKSTTRDKSIVSIIDNVIDSFKADAVLIASEIALFHLTGQWSLNTCRGSAYKHKTKGGRVVRCVPIEDVARINFVPEAMFLLQNDIKKALRWALGKQFVPASFEYAPVRTRADLKFIRETVLPMTEFIATDIETAGWPTVITCQGFAFYLKNGKVFTTVIPLADSQDVENYNFWRKEEGGLEDAISTIKYICESDIPKILQNGTYDAAHLLRYQIVLNNYFLDTMHLFNALYAELEHALHRISALCVDDVEYWKDDIKGTAEEKQAATSKASHGVPVSAEGQETYWAYCARDCYYTLMSCIGVLKIYRANKWAAVNYAVEFPLQMCFMSMGMNGLKMDLGALSLHGMRWKKQSEDALKELRIMIDDPEFNPNSSNQVASLLYDVLQARQHHVAGGKDRSTDEKALKFVMLQHPVYEKIIEKIWETKKPANNYSKYIEKEGKNVSLGIGDYYMYNLNAAGTITGRASGGNHPFWVGTNPQNLPKEICDIFIPPEGYYLFDVDYSQSDAYFVAFDCEDERMIETVLSPKDTHCIHAEFLFKIPYDKLMEGKKNHEAWVEDPIIGVRSNTKKASHGANYQMTEHTLYTIMGHKSVVASAKALGFDTTDWNMRDCTDFCKQYLLDEYYRMYPKLKETFDTRWKEVRAAGGLATCCFDRTLKIFANLEKDAGARRSLSSYYGQGGTAGNINNALLRYFYKSGLYDAGLKVRLQVHDSLIGYVPKDKPELLDRLMDVMEQPITYKGRTFVVPVEADVGLCWKKGMVGHKRGEAFNHEKIRASFEESRRKLWLT